jgi:hypothetical protein
MNLENVLFIDTEHNPNNYEPISIQYLIGNNEGIITEFNTDSYNFLKKLWDNADAVIMYNAPFDLGKLSSIFGEYKWVVQTIDEVKSAAWDLLILGNRYKVRKIGGHRNLIKPMNRVKKTKHKGKGTASTPVIDLLKLWSIMVDDGRSGSIGLKAVVKREFDYDMLKWSEENAKTEQYMLDDVRYLKKLTYRFFEHISNIDDVKNYSWGDWCYIKTPATFTKLAYENNYPKLKDWQEHNDEVLDYYNLQNAVEESYNGGITLSMHRGFVPENTAWVDISSAYVNTIINLNTDSYLKFDIEKIGNDIYEKTLREEPILLKVKGNFRINSINSSLKLYKLKSKSTYWIWSYDIISCKNLEPDFEYEILEAYKPIGLNPVNHSLPEKWIKQKDAEKEQHGKTTLYDYFKFLGNTSYGIKAQRKPFRTKHTNMIIAGMITSRAHLILTDIIRKIREFGFKNIYNDTDSSCFSYSGVMTQSDMDYYVDEINKSIYPYKVESEGYNMETIVLSLKRYVSINENPKLTKIKLHGRGRYNLTSDDALNYTKYGKMPDKRLKVGQVAGNTEISLKQVLNICPQFEAYKHPFMFITNIETDRSMTDFIKSWHNHIDTKTTFKICGSWIPFEREIRTFSNELEASVFFGAYYQDEPDDLISNNYEDYDKQIKQDFIT